MQTERVVLLCTIGNPLATAWVRGLRACGSRVVVADLRPVALNAAELDFYGLSVSDRIITGLTPHDPGSLRLMFEALGGEPTTILGWWGEGVLRPLTALRQALPAAGAVHVVDTFPNAAMPMTEAREVVRYASSTWGVDGFVHYSRCMADAFSARIPAARSRPHAVMPAAFPLAAFVGEEGATPARNTPRLNREDDRPHVVFTGRTDWLWERSWRSRKDAMGPFLVDLADSGVRVVISDWERADRRGAIFLTYPRFSNKELLDGTFAGYLDQFDAQLLLYNEWNRTVSRRVRNGLSTRLANAMTATSPVVVSPSSAFVHEAWVHDGQWGFAPTNMGELVDRLQDREALHEMRQTMADTHRQYGFEAYSSTLQELFVRARARRRRSRL